MEKEILSQAPAMSSSTVVLAVDIEAEGKEDRDTRPTVATTCSLFTLPGSMRWAWRA